jgi:hypothetical protein
MREEATEKERDGHFNDIRLVILTKQLLINDGCPPQSSMDINMVFTLSAEFRGAKEEVAQICLTPKEVMFEKPEESS